MTRNDRLAAYLIARPHEWIENRQTPYWDGVETYIVSEYRYVPAVSA